jgi:hypothetical protein
VYHLYVITQHALPKETIPLFCYNYNAETVLDEELQASSDDELFQIGLQSGHRPGGQGRAGSLRLFRCAVWPSLAGSVSSGC